MECVAGGAARVCAELVGERMREQQDGALQRTDAATRCGTGAGHGAGVARGVLVGCAFVDATVRSIRVFEFEDDAHLSTLEPGFTMRGVFVVPTAFNPHLIRLSNGTFILYFRVNDFGEAYAACTGKGPRTNSTALRSYIDPRDITHTDPSGEGPGA